MAAPTDLELSQIQETPNWESVATNETNNVNESIATNKTNNANNDDIAKTESISYNDARNMQNAKDAKVSMNDQQTNKMNKYTLIILIILFVFTIGILLAITISSINTNNRLINTNDRLMTIIENAAASNSKVSNEELIALLKNTSTTNDINDTDIDINSCNQTESIYLSSKPNEALKLWHHSLPNRILPGVQFLSYSFNQLQGSPPTDLILQGNYRQIIEFTYLEQRVSSGSDDYLVPDQLDLPSISGVCSKESSTSSVSSSTSTSSMFSESAESTGQKSFSASVSASGWGSSMSGSVAMSSSYSNSRSSTASKQYARSGKTSSSYTYSKALLYSTQLRWDTIDSYRDEFISAINTIEAANGYTDINRNILIFFGDFGTHVLDLAKMGARCRQTTYFSSSMSSEAQSNAAQQAGSSSNSYSGSFSASYSGFGVSGSASAAYAQSSSLSTTGSAEGSQELSESFETSTETLDCVGEVDISSLCGQMLGIQDEPALVGYKMKQIWTLPIFDTYPKAQQYLIDTIIKINEEAEICGFEHCGGVAICGIDKRFWSLSKYKKWNSSSSLSSLWYDPTCFDKYQFGISLIKSGYNISTQMNQCNRTSNIKWGNRYESRQINYDPFCSGNMQIAVGLNLINRSINFKSIISNIQNDGFKLQYGLLSDGDMECTSIGGISYALFCDDSNVRINRITTSSDSVTWFPGKSALHMLGQITGNGLGWYALPQEGHGSLTYGPYTNASQPPQCGPNYKLMVTFELIIDTRT
eukprot:116367_1